MRKKIAILSVVSLTLVASLLGCGISEEVKEEAGVTSEESGDEVDNASEEGEEVDAEAYKEFQFFTGYGTVSEEHWFDISYIESAEVVESTEDGAKVSPYMIVVQFTEEGAKTLDGYSEDLLGRDLYLRIDGNVCALVQIQEYMIEEFADGKLMIVDEFITTKEQAQNVADQINAKVQEKQ